MSTHEKAERTDPEGIYASWRERRDRGTTPSLDALCARFPEQADQLRALDAKFERIGKVLALESTSANVARGGDPKESDPFVELVARLRRHQPNETRYEERREIARGGMGRVLEVYDVDLRRALAKKVMLTQDAVQEAPPAIDPSSLGRFFEEAQVTAQLGHPGVVPVHELGIDEAGRVYFTMDLVVGRTLQDVFELARKGSEDWNVTRAAGVIVRVCETMAYAHSKGVIHRDLKPSNVMVGSFGEVYVMDWGLAKLLGDSKEPVTVDGTGRSEPVSTDRRDASGRDTFAGLKTETGQAAGTPGYMAPEQASGEVRSLDARTDVYAIGALLYSLLTGVKPYEAIIKGRDVGRFLAAMREGLVVPIRKLAPEAPAELVSIAERAMAKRQEDRYPDAKAMAADLRAWLEGRVVSAHEQGAWAELRKWVRRNRALAAALLTVLIAVLGGASGMAAIQNKRRLEVEHKQLVAQVSEGPTTVAGLWAETEELWPSTPDRVPNLARWHDELDKLMSRRPLFEQALASMSGKPSVFGSDELDSSMRKPLEDALSRLSGELVSRTPWMHDRLEIARTLNERSVSGPDASARWIAARESIASLPAYGNMKLEPQLGLVPLRRDPASGLWEFWHVLSGAEPRVDPATNRWRVEDATGVVLVLILGGRSQVGSPVVPPDDLLFDWYRDYDQSDPLNHTVTLNPFFISKYELTQAQWRRARNANASQGQFNSETHPADTVSWDEGMETLRRLDLVLPTEAQWEVAGRGGKATRLYTGQDPASLRGHVVLRPQLDPGKKFETDADGRPLPVFGRAWSPRHEPVGSCDPNPYGLHDVHGNVKEWCLDVFDRSAPPRDGDGLRVASSPNPKRVLRGGSFDSTWDAARLPHRQLWEHQNGEPDTGVRPARAVR